MASIVAVGDPDDQRVAEFVHLTDRDLRRRRLESSGVEGDIVIVEGLVAIGRLLGSPYRVRSLLCTPAALIRLMATLDVDAVTGPLYIASQPVMDAVTGFNVHRGALASADRAAMPSLEELAGRAIRLLAVEDVTDTENVGALFRNAAAFGADGVVLSPQCADPLYRRAVRVSVGHVLRMPFTRAGDWPVALSSLRRSGFELLALTPDGDADDIGTITTGGREVLLVGAEGPGLSGPALEAADRRVRIPMAAGVDSINVATAAAIALHHLASA